jgi:8-oxo-dGTP pyrophosphatase MutT (NUDIX family)
MEDRPSPGMRVDGDFGGHWAGSDGSASGVLPIAQSTARVCLALRSRHVHCGRCWGTIGGASMTSLGPAENAERELREETGYSGLLRLFDAFVFKDGNFAYHNYIGLVPNEFPLLPNDAYRHETDKLLWVGIPALKAAVCQRERRHLFHFGLVELLRHSYDLIQGIMNEYCQLPDKAYPIGQWPRFDVR